MATRPRVLIRVRPLVFATALARILEDRGLEVDIGEGGDRHDLAVVTTGAGERSGAAVEIAVPDLEGDRIAVRVTDSRRSRSVVVQTLDDLLGLIDRELLAHSP